MVVGAIAMGSEQPARAGAPSEQTSVDVLPVVVIAEVASLLGEDMVILPGWLEARRQPPRLEGATEVVDLEIVNLELRGASRLGLVSVVERPDQGEAYRSTGEIRSLQPGSLFPATGFIELSLDLDLPATIIGTLPLHNETPLRLGPTVDGVTVPAAAWPALVSNSCQVPENPETPDVAHGSDNTGGQYGPTRTCLTKPTVPVGMYWKVTSWMPSGRGSTAGSVDRMNSVIPPLTKEG